MSKRKVITTRLNAEELRLFKRVARFVKSYCGPVSNAEVLRFLVRNWSQEGSSDG